MATVEHHVLKYISLAQHPFTREQSFALLAKATGSSKLLNQFLWVIVSIRSERGERRG
jgi:hypothetical protein